MWQEGRSGISALQEATPLSTLFRAQSLPLILPQGADQHSARPPRTADGSKDDDGGEPTVVLPLFGSRVLHSLPFTAPASASSSAPPQDQPQHGSPPAPASTHVNTDMLCFTGGLIWRFDFCPHPLPPPGGHHQSEQPQHASSSGSSSSSWLAVASHTRLLAVSVHPCDSTRHKLGTLLRGPGAVQLWAVPNSRLSPCCPCGQRL